MSEISGEWPIFEEIAARLLVANTPFCAAYVHGRMSGLLCTDTRPMPLVLESFLSDIEFDESLAQDELLNKLFVVTATHLEEGPGAMQMLLPDDDAPLSERCKALGEWCNGFLEGVALENQALQLEIVQEVLADLAKIKEITFKIKSTKENETAYTEVVEFIRVAVLLVHAECHPVKGNENSLPIH
jgi:uncharacterized protein YgfB (UPF0149 family)